MEQLTVVSDNDSKDTQVRGGAASQQHVLAEKRIGNFVVERLIGEGAMGTVYLGVHPTLNRKVAIKVLKAELASDADLVERFAIEARAASGLGHPGFVEVLDFGKTEQGRHYQVMEFLEGQDLEGVLEQSGAMRGSRAARLIAQAADALSVAHQNGIVHRDLKPANLFVTRSDGDVEQIKVLDFGIAKLLGSAAEGKRTQAGTMLGTPMYASPEQARGQSIDARSDIYSLGVVLFELLSGAPPFTGGPLDLLNAHANLEPPNLADRAPRVSPGLLKIVMSCLQKDPGARPQSMQVLAGALRLEFDAAATPAGHLPTIALPGAATTSATPTSGSRAWIVALAVALLVAVGVGGYLFWSAGGVTTEADVELPEHPHPDAVAVALAPPDAAPPSPPDAAEDPLASTVAEKPVAPARPAFSRSLRSHGKQLFRKKCVNCHGRKGRGDGPDREFLGRNPSDLTRGVFKLRSTPKDALPTDEDLFRTLTAGMGVGGMPSFAKLSANDRWALVAYVESLSSRFRRRPSEVDVFVVPAPPMSVSVQSGKELFSLSGCVKCHGESGSGDGPKAGDLKDHLGRKIAVPNFRSAYRFIGGGHPVDIYRTMMTGIAGTPMPSGSDFFDEKEAWDVVAYIRSLRK